jgi:hypothetical protein
MSTDGLVRANELRARVAYERARVALESDSLDEAVRVFGRRDGLQRTARRHPDLLRRYTELADIARVVTRAEGARRLQAARVASQLQERAELVEDIEYLAANTDPTREEIAERYGVTWDAIWARLKRAGRRDLGESIPSRAQLERTRSVW